MNNFDYSKPIFVNLYVHASYQSDSKLLVLKYPDRIVFSNPGTMLVSKEQYFYGGESICRNPALQTMFSMIGAVEKAGSGADTILKGWDETNNPYYFRNKNIPRRGHCSMFPSLKLRTEDKNKCFVCLPVRCFTFDKPAALWGRGYYLSLLVFEAAQRYYPDAIFPTVR